MVSPADVPASYDSNSLVCPTSAKAQSESQKQFGGLSNPAQPQARDEPYDAADDFSRSLDDCYRAIRARVAAGGKGWPR